MSATSKAPETHPSKRPPGRAPGVTARRLALLLGLVVTGPSCEEAASTAANDPDLLVSIDGRGLLRSEFEPIVAYFEAVDPSLGARTLRRRLLDRHFLPMLLSRRDHGTARSDRRQEAEALVRGIATGAELSQRVRLMGIEPIGFAWSDIPIPLRPHVFDPSLVGGLAPVVEIPNGALVFAPLALNEGLSTPYSRVEGLLIGFPVLPEEEFASWIDSARRSLRRADLYVHPELENCLPDWFSDALRH